MKKIHKITNIALIFMLIGVFLWTDYSYSFSVRSYSLRVPFGNYEREKDILISQELERKYGVKIAPPAEYETLAPDIWKLEAGTNARNLETSLIMKYLGYLKR